MIEIKNISKSFKDKQVLFDISGKFEKGRTNLIIGASGTGKSVLLKCLVGLLEPDVGSVLFDGRDFSRANKKLTTEIRREIGMLFQGSALFDSKNVEENINEDGVVELKLNLAQEDKGRVIGRKGQVARSIRSILRVGAVKRNQVIRLLSLIHI